MLSLVALAGDNTTYMSRDVRKQIVIMVPTQSEPNHVNECTGFEIPCASPRQRSRETQSRGVQGYQYYSHMYRLMLLSQLQTSCMS